MTEPNQPAGRPVVVGVDGSDHSLAAADLAANEAARRGLPLEIVYGYLPPPPPMAPMPPAMPSIGMPELGEQLLREQAALREYAERVLHDAGSRLRASHPDLPIVTRLRDGNPAEVLADASRQATLVVVGHRGVGGFTGLLTGSVGVQLAEHAGCPVIITRGQPAAGAPVVVGVDGSAESRLAAEFAADAAQWYGSPLTVLCAWTPAASWLPGRTHPDRPPAALSEAIDQVVAELVEQHPRLKVRPEVRQARAHEALVSASEPARLVVVGSRGLGGFRGLLLGSVSRALIHHAHCPVAVVR